MLEITRARTTIVSCMDHPAILDDLPVLAGSFRARTAPDELWLIAPASAAAAVLTHAESCLSRSSGLALDVSDGWTVITVRGDAHKVWERFSENPVPSERPVFVQGAVASAPAKAIVLDELIHFIVPSTQGYHLPHRVLTGCYDLGPRVTGTTEFVVPSTARNVEGVRA